MDNALPEIGITDRNKGSPQPETGDVWICPERTVRAGSGFIASWQQGRLGNEGNDFVFVQAFEDYGGSSSWIAVSVKKSHTLLDVNPLL